jgi:SAM-dependent methyltransferase
MGYYTADYYRALQEGARRSAEVIVPLVLELVQPRSVIDVGCGVGTWLSVFKECDVADIWGVDGEHIERAMLEFPPERFLPFDLEHPFRVGRRFDLVVSLEVAEHLPASCAETFVESLALLGPVVLFSAAVPFQGGEHHVNGQWPEYWANLFRERDYVAIDCLRRRIWHNESVDWWYAQNVLLFAAREHVERQPLFRSAYELAGPSPLALVHPKLYLEWVEWALSQYES